MSRTGCYNNKALYNVVIDKFGFDPRLLPDGVYGVVWDGAECKARKVDNGYYWFIDVGNSKLVHFVEFERIFA